ncbi:hypothetical protein [Novosphingobium mangrovi (ex Hu et al. 2023)]|uniref:Uncharacterized protein n=1 Tax=Novosphingobium mangrovi (ex Hu et al. 2023) TaxID=2930094 RepID=A0ABT0AB04_9SPHN|nr:hypothetical protein [Novosphingobium mangrovi (ex Hu et al. 2023)]MCJ1960364.1 hypothetical protein [Novosphingobium mangrovi (ex Hu et al. 2023)]
MTSANAREVVRYGGFDPVARDAWLVDCYQKVALRDAKAGIRPGTDAPDECQAYLDAYYERYTRTHTAPSQIQAGPGFTAPGYEASHYGADYTVAVGPSFTSEEVVQSIP